jgi:C_GCAxxG_C_C family probable redox protein
MLLAVGKHLLGDLEPQSIRMASALAGGVGRTHQEMCGALGGGVLVIGALFGRASLDQDDQVALDLAALYRARFLAAFGHTQCARLRESVVDAPGGLGSCAVLVERAASLLLELLQEHDARGCSESHEGAAR